MRMVTRLIGVDNNINNKISLKRMINEYFKRYNQEFSLSLFKMNLTLVISVMH